MKQERKVHPTLSFQGKRNTINIGIDVIRMLGEPKAICLLQNMKNYSVAVVPCNPTDVLSFKVPEKFLLDRNSKFCIHSKQFVKGIMRSSGLNPEQTYVFSGIYNERNNAVVFFIREGEEI